MLGAKNFPHPATKEKGRRERIPKGVATSDGGHPFPLLALLPEGTLEPFTAMTFPCRLS